MCFCKVKKSFFKSGFSFTDLKICCFFYASCEIHASCVCFTYTPPLGNQLVASTASGQSLTTKNLSNHQTTADFSQSDLTQVWQSIWRINQVYRWPWAIQKELCLCLNHCWGKKQLMWLSLWLCRGWLFWREGESLKLHEMWYAVVRHESLSQVYCCKFLPVLLLLLLLLTILPSPFPSPAFDILTAAGAEFWISQQTR